MSDSAHDLIQRYMSGWMEEEERQAFLEALRTDGELRALYLHYANLDIALEGKAGLSQLGASRLVAAGRRSGEGWLRRVRRHGVSIAAVAAALVVWFLVGSGGWGRVIGSGEGVEVQSRDGLRVARSGEVLRRGDEVRSLGAGGGKIEVKGLGLVGLGPDTVVRCRPRERVLDIERGFVEIEALRQPKDRPWRQRTTNAETAVIGTRFALAAKDGRTALRVSEGSVRLTNLSSGESESVEGGNRAFVRGGDPFEVRGSRTGSVLVLTSRTAPAGDFVGAGDLKQRVRALKMLGLIAERLVVSRLWQLGFRVEVRHFDEVRLDDLHDRALVVVSMMADGAGEGAIRRLSAAGLDVPMICLDPDGYRFLGMVGDDGGTSGFTDDASDSMAIEGDHVLNGVLKGSVMGLTGALKGWGRPMGGGVVHASLGGQPGRAVWFSYEKGSEMATGAAPARRVGIFLDPHGITLPTNNMWRAFDESVDWAVAEVGGGR